MILFSLLFLILPSIGSFTDSILLVGSNLSPSVISTVSFFNLISGFFVSLISACSINSWQVSSKQTVNTILISPTFLVSSSLTVILLPFVTVLFFQSMQASSVLYSITLSFNLKSILTLFICVAAKKIMMIKIRKTPMIPHCTFRCLNNAFIFIIILPIYFLLYNTLYQMEKGSVHQII